MQKISSSTATANGAGEFTKGQPGSGVDATMITVDWLNAIQRELVNLVVGSGQTLAPADDGQVLKAVKALQELASAWDKISGKPTTRNGYALSDVFTKTETGTAIQQAIAAWVGTAPAALDTLVELAASLGNDPNFATTVMNALAAKMPTTGGAYNPKFSGASFNAEARGYNGSGGFIGWGADASGTMQFICNKGSGNTGGFVFGSVNADNASLGPLMTYTPGGALGVPAALSVPAITSNTTVSTQSPGYAGSYIVNGAFVAAAVQYKVNGSSCIEVGFVGGDVAAPYLKHTNGTVVRVQVDRPKDTALLDPTGWSKNADTGEIRQWLEVDAGDIPTTKSINVAWQFQFPNAITSVRISIRKTNTSTACVQAYYRNPTRDGCTIDIEEWSGVVQSGLVICVEARGK